MAGSRQDVPSWISAAAATRVDLEGNVETMFNKDAIDESSLPHSNTINDFHFGFRERAFSAAAAAFLSAIIVNPLDVAKTRLQAQASGVPYQGLCRPAGFESNVKLPDMRNSSSCSCVVPGSEPAAECNRYKGTLDVFHKVTSQQGFSRLWRGTSASLALAVPTVGIYLPCYDIFRNLMEDFTTHNTPSLTPYVPLVAGSVARLLACVSCYPVELARTRMQAFKVTQTGVKPPGVWKTLVGVVNPVKSTNNLQNLQNYRICGLVLEHNLLVMFHSLQSAGQPSSLSGEIFSLWWVMKPRQPVS